MSTAPVNVPSKTARVSFPPVATDAAPWASEPPPAPSVTDAVGASVSKVGSPCGMLGSSAPRLPALVSAWWK